LGNITPSERLRPGGSAPDPLQARRDRRRRLDLHHQIDGPHVDPELERGGGDDGGQGAALEPVLHLLPLVARHRAVVGERHLGPGQLVERAPPSAPPGGASWTKIIVERCSRISRAAWDGWKARCFSGPVSRKQDPTAALQLAELRQIVHRDFHPDLELLLRAGVDDGDRPRPPPLPTDLAAAEEACHFVQRPLGGREADALQLAPGQLLKPLQGEEEVRAALGCDQRVDLVDDDGSPPSAGSPGPARST